MNRQNTFYLVLALASIVILTLFTSRNISLGQFIAQTEALAYPAPSGDLAFPTPDAYPAPSGYPAPAEPDAPPPISSPTSEILPVTPPPPSEYAVATINVLAQRLSVAADELAIVADYAVDLYYLERSFQTVTLVDLNPSGKFYSFLVDHESGEIYDPALLRTEAGKALQDRYGKLEPSLHQRLREIQDHETVDVFIWAAPQANGTVAERQVAAIEELEVKYPDVTIAFENGELRTNASSTELAVAIELEFVLLLQGDVTPRTETLLKVTATFDPDARTFPGLPAVAATLTKTAILQMAQRSDVGAIYLAEGGEVTPELNSAIPTNLAPIVWDLGYDGSGIRIGFVEPGNVDFVWGMGQCPNSFNCFRHPIVTLGGYDGVYDHGTLVASAAASDHPIYRGVAPGAGIISAGIPGTQHQHQVEALSFAIERGADVINASYGLCTSPPRMIHVLDKVFDWYARYWRKLIVKSAGNSWNPCGHYVTTPGKGWNIFTVEPMMI